MSRRLVIVPAAGLLCAGLLAACGSEDNDTSSSEAGSVNGARSGAPSGGSGGGGMGGDVDCSDAGTPTAAPSDAVPESDDAAQVTAVVDAATAFLDTLDSEEQDALSHDYSDLETKECGWSNFPDGLFNGRVGLRMGDLSDDQVTAAMAVVEAAMSETGYTYLTQQLLADEQLASGDDDTTCGDQN